jgi:hypothetical protein
MSNTWMVLNIIVLLGLIIYVIRYKHSPQKQRNQKKEGQFRIYEEEKDTQIRHYRRSNFITSHPNDTDRCGTSINGVLRCNMQRLIC